jgi:RNA polymerase sigma-70 factor (ECF subfamily)
MRQDDTGRKGHADEDEWVTRCQAGDLAAFGELTARYRNQVFAITYNAIRNEQDAWDLSQEVFLKAWRNIGRFRGQSSFFTWIYRIAVNVTIDALRRKRIEGGVEFDEATASGEIEPGAVTVPRGEPLPHQRLENREIQGRIDSALEKLSPEHRLVVILREVDGLSYEEIAEAMDCSVGTVMSRLFYARKKLQGLLKDVYDAI